MFQHFRYFFARFLFLRARDLELGIRQIEEHVAPLARLDAAQTIVDEVYKLI